MKNKTALITGVGGQDGTLLTKVLLDRGYEIYGLTRNLTDPLSNFDKIDMEEAAINRIIFDDLDSIASGVDEVYNFAAQSSVGESWRNPVQTQEINFMFFVKLISKFRNTKTKILQASSSEMYKSSSDKLTELSELDPISPYGFSKLFAYRYSKFLRDQEGLKIFNAILFNHESPLRDERFLFRKITSHVADYSRGKQEILKVGNVDIVRDWGSAQEYVGIMNRILQDVTADDYFVCTGIVHNIKDIIKYAFEAIEVKIYWEGDGLEAKAYDSNKKLLVEVDKEIFRPNEVEFCVGDNSKLQNNLGIKPEVRIEEVVEEMVKAEMN